MNPVNASEFEALVSAQRSAMMRDIPRTDAPVTAELPTLRKAELIVLLCERVGLNAQEAKEMVAAFFEVVSEALENGETVKLSSFGCFRLRDKLQRPGRNPQTGTAALIPARRVVTFHASQKLKMQVETGGEQRRHD